MKDFELYEPKSIGEACHHLAGYRGRARVIKNLYKLKQCRSDEVLVTTMTRPQFNSVIKRVGAIVADEGGIF